MMIAGVNAMTIAPHLVEELKGVEWTEEKVHDHSLFFQKHTDVGLTEKRSFINDETAFREQFGKNDEGKGETKTKQVSIFVSVLWDSNSDNSLGYRALL